MSIERCRLEAVRASKVVERGPQLRDMDLRVVQRACAAVGEELVDGGHPGRVQIAGMLEDERELKELVPDGGDPIRYQDGVPRWGCDAVRGSAQAGGKAAALTGGQ